MREPWRYNPQHATAIDLDGCQFGLTVDGRCNTLLCKFRTQKEEAPETPVQSCLVMCPREQEYEISRETTRLTG